MLLNHMPFWTDALRAKSLGQGEPWGRSEFDRAFKGFDCAVDVPCNLFPSELVNAYPQALVILNTRSPASWHASMDETIFHVFRWISWPLLAKLDAGFTKTWYTHCMLTWSIFCSNDYRAAACTKAYEKHNDHVRSVVPKERLLEYEVEEGWGPLCRFLGKEVPTEDFPWVNDTGEFVENHRMLWAYSVFNAARNVVGVSLVSLGVGALAWWMYRTKNDLLV